MLRFDTSKRGFGPCVGEKSGCRAVCGQRHFYITLGDMVALGLTSLGVGMWVMLRMVASPDSVPVQVSSLIVPALVLALGSWGIWKYRVTARRNGKPEGVGYGR